MMLIVLYSFVLAVERLKHESAQHELFSHVNYYLGGLLQSILVEHDLVAFMDRVSLRSQIEN